MSFSRRGFLAGSSAAMAALATRPAWADQNSLYWQAGWETAPAEGFAPTEMTLVRGKLPEGLNGALYRNGPAQFRYGDKTLPHWFDGDGMVHSIRFANGKAVHTGRFVQTEKRRIEQAQKAFVVPGFGTEGDPNFAVSNPDAANAANTSVLRVGDDLLALWEAGSAFAMDPVSLETRGPKTWREDLKGMPFLAHPKVEPNGTIWNLGIGGSRVGIYKISPAGALQEFGLVDTGLASYIHDFAMTERSLIILVQPWVYKRNIPPFTASMAWEPEHGLKVLIVDKNDFSKTRWAEMPPRFFFHTGDAWEDESGTIHMDIATYENADFVEHGEADIISGKYQKPKTAPAQMAMAVIPKTGEAKLIDTGLPAEFPRIDPRYQGQVRNQVWMIDTSQRDHAPGSSIIRRLNWDSVTPDAHDFGREHMVEEHLFVPRPGSDNEGDGWLVGTTLNMRERATEVHVFDAMRINHGPLASFRAPYAWPLGFHGTWASA
ncbi:MAG: carotenoid oxygenase [Ponticaulis sp.]|nr:carotenoid oxygenase [Ponticaulis sp.]|tara:strand:- start:5762 stop:7228 length:1467 start_codon:yes stop_codon:yes gene_type:complete